MWTQAKLFLFISWLSQIFNMLEKLKWLALLKVKSTTLLPTYDGTENNRVAIGTQLLHNHWPYPCYYQPYILCGLTRNTLHGLAAVYLLLTENQAIWLYRSFIISTVTSTIVIRQGTWHCKVAYKWVTATPMVFVEWTHIPYNKLVYKKPAFVLILNWHLIRWWGEGFLPLLKRLEINIAGV